MLNRLVLICLTAFSAVSTDLYLPALPQLVAEFDASVSQVQLTLSVFLLGFALGQLFYGYLSDYYGRKPLLYLGLLTYLVATLACIFASDIEMLIVARGVQGIGAAAGPVLARAMVSDNYRGALAAKTMAAIASAMAVVPAIAPVIGGWLLHVFQWQALFVALCIFALINMLGVMKLPESCPTIGQQPLRLSDLVIQIPFCLGNRNFVGFSLCGGALFAGLFCFISTASFIVIELLGVAPVNFGYAFMVMVAGYGSGARICSIQVSRRGIMTVLKFGQCIAVLSALYLLFFAAIGSTNLYLVLFGFFLLALATGSTLPISQMGAVFQFSARAGRASAVFGFLQVIMASLAGFLVGYFYDHSLWPTALGIAACALLSVCGYRLIDHQAVAQQQAGH